MLAAYPQGRGWSTVSRVTRGLGRHESRRFRGRRQVSVFDYPFALALGRDILPFPLQAPTSTVVLCHLNHQSGLSHRNQRDQWTRIAVRCGPLPYPASTLDLARHRRLHLAHRCYELGRLNDAAFGLAHSQLQSLMLRAVANLNHDNAHIRLSAIRMTLHYNSKLSNLDLSRHRGQPGTPDPDAADAHVPYAHAPHAHDGRSAFPSKIALPSSFKHLLRPSRPKFSLSRLIRPPAGRPRTGPFPLRRQS